MLLLEEVVVVVPHSAADDALVLLLVLAPLLLVPLTGGKAGNADADADGAGREEEDEPATHDGVDAGDEDPGPALDRRDCCVEFLSLRTRVVCLWLPGTALAAEVAPAPAGEDAAEAQPLLAVVAPRMPPKPGRVG